MHALLNVRGRDCSGWDVSGQLLLAECLPTRQHDAPFRAGQRLTMDTAGYFRNQPQDLADLGIQGFPESFFYPV